MRASEREKLLVDGARKAVRGKHKVYHIARSSDEWESGKLRPLMLVTMNHG